MYTNWNLVNSVWDTGYIALVRNILDAFTIAFLLFITIASIMNLKSRTIYYGVGLFVSWMPLFVAVMMPLVFSAVFFLLYFGVFIVLCYFHHFEKELEKVERRGILSAKMKHQGIEERRFQAFSSEEKEQWVSVLNRKNKCSRRTFRIMSICTCVSSYGLGVLLLFLQIQAATASGAV